MLSAVGLGFAGSAATMNCENAVCVVTGASSGLGNAVATELLRRGARGAALDLVGCPGRAQYRGARSFLTGGTRGGVVQRGTRGGVPHFRAPPDHVNCGAADPG